MFEIIFPQKACRLNIPAFIVLSAILVVASTELGCQKPLHTLVPVSGKVTYNGKPLQFGTVMFQPEAGQFATGKIQADGTFQMRSLGEGDGAAVGTNRVCVSCFENQKPEIMEQFKSNPQAGEFLPGKSLIPRKYQSYDTSGITVEVLPNGNDPIIINLTD